MSFINLYKIDDQKHDEFIRELAAKFGASPISTDFSSNLCEEGEDAFYFSLYIDTPQNSKKVSWNWVADIFKISINDVTSFPRAVLLVEYDNNENESMYAVTFGSSFFLVDKYCDSDFGFDFARKVKFKGIKTTTSTIPSSKRNKTISSYIDYMSFDFSSGESFAKIKANVDIYEGFELFKPPFEIGSSIKFSIIENSLDYIAGSILYIENVIQREDEKNKIPVFSKIKDRSVISLLESLLCKSITNETPIYISEVDVIGAWEIFNRSDDNILLKYKESEKYIDNLNEQEIRQFCEEYGISYENVLDIQVTIFQDEHPVVKRLVKELIDYTDDQNKSILSKGVWYRYNDDYIEYLNSSISEIDVNYNPCYDFSTEKYSSFLNKKFEELQFIEKYDGLNGEKLCKKIRNEFYAERVFNEILENDYGFINYDRKLYDINGHSIEIMDLYKDNTMWAVKIGKSSSKLCYVVEQSISSLHLYKTKSITNIPTIDKVGLWLVLERAPLPEEDGRPDLTSLDMLLLKNKIDNWKKEVRLAGLTPVININYRT